MKTAQLFRSGWLRVFGVPLFGMLWFMGEVPAAPPGAPVAPAAGLPGIPPMPRPTAVAFFRELLALPPAARAEALASRPAAKRSVIELKLQEYAALPAAERESRLRAMEFHQYLKVLLSAPPGVREAWTASVPAEYRTLCEERLRLWTVLPPKIQSYMRDRETTLKWLTRWEGAPEVERRQLLASLPQDRRQDMERDVARWQAMSPAERDSAWRATRQMFELSLKDQQRVLVAVSAVNRVPAAKFVDQLRQLPGDQRTAYLDGFRRFSQLDVEKRARYLQGWEQWKKLTEAERDVWRQLASKVPKPPVIPPPSRVGG